LVGTNSLPAVGLSADQRNEAFAALSGAHQAAFRAMSLLVRNRDQTVAFLKERVSPANKIDKERVATLVGQLESQQFAVRDKAARDLAEMGPNIAGELRAALNAAKSAEARNRIKRA